MATAYGMAYSASQMKQPSVRVESSRLAALPHVSAAIEWLRENRPPQDSEWASGVDATGRPAPYFFAGLVFSTTFKREAQPASAFGENLLGATVGGFAEYLGMVVGSQALSLLVIACYLCSYLVLRRVWARPAATALEPVTA